MTCSPVPDSSPIGPIIAPLYSANSAGPGEPDRTRRRREVPRALAPARLVRPEQSPRRLRAAALPAAAGLRTELYHRQGAVGRAARDPVARRRRRAPAVRDE